MAVLGRSRSGAPPYQILDPPLKFVRINLWGDKAELITTEEGQQIKVLDVTTTDKEKTKKYLCGAVACLQSTSSTTVNDCT